jgi:hypothetical protein
LDLAVLARLVEVFERFEEFSDPVQRSAAFARALAMAAVLRANQ